MTMFEVHVEGELGVPTLHSLGCTHCVTKAQTSMRVEATPAELHRLLRECTDHELTIESVVRLETSEKSRVGTRPFQTSAQTELATPTDRVDSTVDTQLAEYPPHVGLHGVDRQEELARDLVRRTHLCE
jgi:hypothetical protein